MLSRLQNISMRMLKDKGKMGSFLSQLPLLITFIFHSKTEGPKLTRIYKKLLLLHLLMGIVHSSYVEKDKLLKLNSDSLKTHLKNQTGQPKPSAKAMTFTNRIHDMVFH